MQVRKTKLAGAVEASGLRRERIAADAEITVQHLRNLEAGRNRPGLDLARRLADVLGVPLDALFPEPAEVVVRASGAAR
jgi:transcriptional regulator with XRE-family HTH domain